MKKVALSELNLGVHLLPFIIKITTSKIHFFDSLSSQFQLPLIFVWFSVVALPS